MGGRDFKSLPPHSPPSLSWPSCEPWLFSPYSSHPALPASAHSAGRGEAPPGTQGVREGGGARQAKLPF